MVAPRPTGPRAARPLDVALLAQCLTVCPETGVIFWRADRPASHFPCAGSYAAYLSRCAGKPAGYLNDLGYIKIRIFNQRLYANRVGYALHTGQDVPPGHRVLYGPAGRLDNRGANLTARPMAPLAP